MEALLTNERAVRSYNLAAPDEVHAGAAHNKPIRIELSRMNSDVASESGFAVSTTVHSPNESIVVFSL